MRRIKDVCKLMRSEHTKLQKTSERGAEESARDFNAAEERAKAKERKKERGKSDSHRISLQTSNLEINFQGNNENQRKDN